MKTPKLTPQEQQLIAALECGYGSIHLERTGNHVIVQVESQGKWITVIKEHLDGNFSHTVHPIGILEEINDKKGQAA